MQGSKLELPLWLAKGLFDHKRRILSVELPKIYQEGWRTVFSADANVVDLHKMGPHFYGFGSQLLHFDSPENADVSQSLLQASAGAGTTVALPACRGPAAAAGRRRCDPGKLRTYTTNAVFRVPGQPTVRLCLPIMFILT